MRHLNVVLLVLCIAVCWSCDEDDPKGASSILSGTVGSEGLTLIAEEGGELEGVRLVVPAGALADGTTVTLSPADEDTALPEGALRIGPQVRIEASQIEINGQLELELPFDSAQVAEHDQDERQVKVWSLGPAKWSLIEPTGHADERVQLVIDELTVYAAGIKLEN